MSYIVVLNDGDTYTSLNGCTIVEVVGDGEVDEHELKDITGSTVGTEVTQDDGTTLRLVQHIEQPTE